MDAAPASLHTPASPTTAFSRSGVKEFVIVWLVIIVVAFAVLALPYAASAETAPAAPLIVAHRGASFDAPENTAAAFKLAIEQNADALEGDFHLTADGQIVCFHDKTAARTAGVDRKIAEMTLAELQPLDVGTWKSPAFAAERPITLGEALKLLPPGKKFFLEIKCGVEILPAFKQVLAAYEARFDDLRVISFNADVIAAVKKQLPQIKAYWLVDFETKKGKIPPTPETILSTLARIQADGLDAQANLDHLTTPFLRSLKDSGYELHVWTVDNPELAKALIARGAASITTNRPGVMRTALGL